LSSGISLHGRMAVFDALTSVRPYKQGWSTDKALAWMFDRDQQFDRKLVLRLGAIIES
jgi:HD-GYP domain-containing protein (c-di-GMP phosphodiesterase class II)